MLYAVRNECERRGKYRGSNDAETYGRQVVDDLEAQNRIDKINTYCVSVPDDTKHESRIVSQPQREKKDKSATRNINF